MSTSLTGDDVSSKTSLYFKFLLPQDRLGQHHWQLSKVIIQAKGKPSLNLLTPHLRTCVFSLNSQSLLYILWCQRSDHLQWNLKKYPFQWTALGELEQDKYLRTTEGWRLEAAVTMLICHHIYTLEYMPSTVPSCMWTRHRHGSHDLFSQAWSSFT